MHEQKEALVAAAAAAAGGGPAMLSFADFTALEIGREANIALSASADPLPHHVFSSLGHSDDAISPYAVFVAHQEALVASTLSDFDSFDTMRSYEYDLAGAEAHFC